MTNRQARDIALRTLHEAEARREEAYKKEGNRMPTHEMNERFMITQIVINFPFTLRGVATTREEAAACISQLEAQEPLNIGTFYVIPALWGSEAE